MVEFDFMITRQCNASCPICFTESNSEVGTGLKKSDIVSFLARTNSQHNDIEIHFTGGEPCCFNGFYDLLSELDLLGIKYQFVTNGTLLTTDMLRGLKNLKKIVFSLYGCELYHNKFVGIDGAFQRIVKVIDDISLFNIDIQVNIICFDDNINEIVSLLQHEMFIKIKTVKLYPVLVKGRAERNKTALTGAFYEELTSILKGYRHLSGKIHYYDEQIDNFRGCLNKTSIFIDENGNMFPCLPVASPTCCIGNIKDDFIVLIDLLERANHYRCNEKRRCIKSLVVM